MPVQSADTSMIFSAPVPFSSMWPLTLAGAVPFVVALDFSAPTAPPTLVFATALVLLTAPFVVGTFGDLLGVTFEAVANGFRVGVNLAVAIVRVDDAPNEVLVAGLYDYENSSVKYI